MSVSILVKCGINLGDFFKYNNKVWVRVSSTCAKNNVCIREFRDDDEIEKISNEDMELVFKKIISAE